MPNRDLGHVRSKFYVIHTYKYEEYEDGVPREIRLSPTIREFVSGCCSAGFLDQAKGMTGYM